MDLTDNIMTIALGTRKSPLALVQAQQVADSLRAVCAAKVEIVPMVTSGDKISSGSLADAGGKALFTKELQEALLDGRIDIAVHSVKDMEVVQPPGLVLGAVLPREDARDCLLSEQGWTLETLPLAARIGTSSPRRAALLRHLRPDVQIVELRGNVGTRIAKMQAGQMEATVLAIAGLKRLGLSEHVQRAVMLEPTQFIPAIGQGAIGIEYRQDNEKIGTILRLLNHQPTDIAVRCERAFSRAMEASCKSPIAGWAQVHAETLTLHAMYEFEGQKPKFTLQRGKSENPEEIGSLAAQFFDD